jgi:hypothetical protein
MKGQMGDVEGGSDKMEGMFFFSPFYSEPLSIKVFLQYADSVLVF